MTGYYDYVLASIPLAFLAVAALLGAAGVSLVVAVPAGAAVAALVVGHALFVNGPVAASAGDSPPVTAD